MDTGNWRPTLGGNAGGGESSMASGDWRSKLQADSREMILNNIVDTLKGHVPFSGHEGLQELKKIAMRFEEKIYTAATSQSDYLQKISLKMLTMETRPQNPMADARQSNSAADCVNPSDPGCIMVKSARLARDRYQIFDDLEEREREVLASRPNESYQTRWAQNAKRGLLVERGITIAGLESTTIPATIRQRDWALFTSTREPYHEGLVREFYASMVPEVFRDCGRVWVQGVQVEISAEAINEYLHTRTNSDDEYKDGFSIYDNYYPELREMAAALRQSKSDIWIPGTTELNHGELEPGMAFWSVFIKHSLVPSAHRTVVSIETARLLYAIQTGVRFDVGHFIFGSILKTGCDTNHRCLLNFPCLITHFCRMAGIMVAFDEAALEAPPTDICKKAYNSFCTRHDYPNVTAGGRYRNRGRQAAAAQQQEPPAQGAGPQPPQGGGHPENPPPWGEQLIHTVTEVRDNLNRLYNVVDRRFTGTTYQRRQRRDAPRPSSSRHQEEDSD